MPARAHVHVAVGLAAGLVLVAALLAFAGPANVAKALAQADGRLVAAAVLAYAGFFALRGARWRLLLGPGEASAGTAAAMTASGWLVSTVAPLKAGDVLRAAWMARRHKAPFGAVAGTVAIERTLDVLGLALAASAGLLAIHFVGLPVPELLAELVAIAWLLPLAGAAFLLALAGAVPTPKGNHLVARLLRVVRQALDQLPALARRPRRMAAVLALTLASVAAQCLVYAFLVAAVVTASTETAGEAWVAALAGAPLFLLSFGLAITPGHLGTYEAAFVLVYAALGLADASTLLAAALGVHLLTAGIVAVLGGIAFGVLGMTGPRPPPATIPSRPSAPTTPPAERRAVEAP